MKFTQLASVALISSVLATTAWGQTGKELDITLSIVDEQDSPDAIINRIQLPPVTAVATSEMNSNSSSSESIEATLNNLRSTSDKLLDDAGQVLSDSVSDAIGTGDLGNLPGDIIEALPDDLLDDVVDQLPDTPLVPPLDNPLPDLLNQKASPNLELDNALNDLESSLTDELPLKEMEHNSISPINPINDVLVPQTPDIQTAPESLTLPDATRQIPELPDTTNPNVDTPEPIELPLDDLTRKLKP